VFFIEIILYRMSAEGAPVTPSAQLQALSTSLVYTTQPEEVV
jgi:hypothetical protein